MYLYLLLFFCAIPLGGIIFAFTESSEGGSFASRLALFTWATVFNIIPFGGFGDVTPRTLLGQLVSILLRVYCLICFGGAVYSALQASLFEQVDKITAARFRQLAAKPMDIFISYRRSDSAGHSGRIYDRLSAAFGAEHVFMDIDTIIPGEDFIQVIEKTISSCDLIVAVIGPGWSGNGGKESRLFNQNDFVRLEIKHALEHQTPVIPVLINQASLPTAAELPEDIQGISVQPALELSDANWNTDFQKLIDMIGALNREPVAAESPMNV